MLGEYSVAAIVMIGYAAVCAAVLVGLVVTLPHKHRSI
jgi:hypothetical protein